MGGMRKLDIFTIVILGIAIVLLMMQVFKVEETKKEALSHDQQIMINYALYVAKAGQWCATIAREGEVCFSAVTTSGTLMQCECVKKEDIRKDWV